MKIKPYNITNQKLIGFKVKIITLYDNLPKWEGIIINETQNMFIIKDEKTNTPKKIPKKGNLFNFYLEDKIIEVNGKILIGRPEDRIKMKRKF
ncbi:MAG: ribonuclease P protein subunit [Promethearchaeota archaeon]|nr:MAG: ribonuclease P protein subunit [Candidatus Lokiarchaeota archaeon]